MRHKNKKIPLSQGSNKIQNVDVNHKEINIAVKLPSAEPAIMSFANQSQDSLVKSEDYNVTKFPSVTENSLDLANATSVDINSEKEIFNKLTMAINSNIKQNMLFAQDLLSCKNANDFLSIQEKLFQSNLLFVMNFIQNLVKF